MHQSERNSRRVPVRENMPLQIRGWQIERVGWYGLLLLVALALAGLFSKGPLSDARLASPGVSCRCTISASCATALRHCCW